MHESQATVAVCSLRATVGKIRTDVAQGFAVCYPELNGQDVPDELKEKDITFSLKDWQGEDVPKNGQIVILENIQLFKKGWRASKASPIRPQSKVSSHKKGDR